MSLAQRNTWRFAWLGCIRDLTSLDLQQHRWLDIDSGNPYDSFTEFLCYYFDDVLADKAYQQYIDEGWIRQVEFDCIKAWHEQLDMYDSPDRDDNNVKAILADPKWQTIVGIGEHARHCLLSLLDSQEREILLNSVDGA